MKSTKPLKLASCTIVLFFLTMVCKAQQQFTYNQGGIVNKDYYEEIPYETANGKMFITVKIGGKKRKFLFDTGAPAQITYELYNKLKPPVIKYVNATDANGRKDSVDVVSIPEFKLNFIEFKNIPAVLSNSEIYQCWGIDGVLGSNLFYNSIIRIEADKHRIIITNDDKKLSLANREHTDLITDATQGYPNVVVLLTQPKKQTFIAGFDTGDADFLIMTETDMKRFERLNAFKKQSKGYGSGHIGFFGLQKSDSTYRIKFPSVNIGGVTFNNVTTETNNSNLTRLGTKILDYGTVTLDFIHHYFYFEPNTSNTDLGEKQWPIQPIISNDKLIVGIVWQKLKDQVKPGDQIIAVGDTSYSTIDLCGAVNGKFSILKDKQSATLTIKDNKGGIKKINIEKE